MTLNINARLLSALSFAVFFGCLLIQSESQAQHFRRPPGQQLGRFLGIGYGNGYHCRTPGPQTDYYNPYGPKNSYLVSQHQNPGSYSNMSTGYAVGGISGGRSIPHREYTGTKPRSYSVFEELPGQTMSPSFEPVQDRKPQFRNDLEDRDFEDELDLGEDDISEMDSESDDNAFRSRLRDAQDSVINQEFESEGDDGFDSLKESFENLRSESSMEKSDLLPATDK